MKKFIVTALVILSLMLFLIPATIQADNGLSVVESSVDISFPQKITFNISAASDVPITDIRLHYEVERSSFAQVTAEIYVGVIPAQSIETQWIWDMRRTGGLPPGADVIYWWTITDAAGKKIETAPQTVQFNDGRYDWKTIQQGQVTLNWYEGDDSFAEELMAATQEALMRLAANSGASLESPVSLYIYANQSDLIGAMIYPQEWTGGVAYSQYGIIAMNVEGTQSRIESGKRTISHELTHLVINQVTNNPYNYLPNWLNEGLAMTSEGELELSFILALSRADAENSYISVRSLCSPFPADINQTILSYAESYKIVSYLINEYGRDKMFELLDTFRQGSGYDEALKKVYGFDMDELNSLWRSE